MTPMNRKRLIWALRLAALVATVGSVALFAPWRAGLLYLSPLPATVQEQLDDGVSYGLDGMIAYVDRAGQPPAFYAAGWKDRAAKVPADPHALFKIASVSKLYIAAATAKLVATHRLSLDATLADMLPELAGHIANADRITLREMLQHRSGIPNFTAQPEFQWYRPHADAGKTHDTLDLVLDKPADFEPGSDYAYSNTNYLLIGRILDRTLGYSYRDYIKTALLAPLGLKHTYGLQADADPALLASGYVTGYEGDTKSLTFTTPGGEMVATAEDVGIFLRALGDGSLLSADEQAIYASVYPFEHTGLLPGYESFARYDKALDAVVILFVSTSGDEAWLMGETVYGRILSILREHPHA